VRTLPNGEQVPVERPQEQGGAPARGFAAPATGSTLARMKKRSVAPAAEGVPAPTATVKMESSPREEEQKDAEAGAPVSNFAAPAPAAAPPAAAKLAEGPAAVHQKPAIDTSHGGSMSTWSSTKALYGGTANELKADQRKLGGLAATCGKVRDSRGRAIAGAQVTALHDGVRTARTDTEGAFCIPGLAAGDTLTVMHVGFDPWTVVVTPMTSLAIELQPVGTLGPNATMLTGKPQASPTFSGALRAHAFADTAHAPRPDVYAEQSSGIRQLVRDAREAMAIAQREHTAPAFENAAKQVGDRARPGDGRARRRCPLPVRLGIALCVSIGADERAGGQARPRRSTRSSPSPRPHCPSGRTVERWKTELNSR
jgi:hypothetical protein